MQGKNSFSLKNGKEFPNLILLVSNSHLNIVKFVKIKSHATARLTEPRRTIFSTSACIVSSSGAVRELTS